MQESDSLVLEILKLDNGLKMSACPQKELASTLRHFSLCKVSFEEIQKLCLEMARALNANPRKGESGQALAKDLQKSGQLLWEHLLTRPVKEILKSARQADLILSLDEELIHIPWELLYDGATFLCLNFNLGRVVRTREQGGLPQYRSRASAARMLILANPTSDLEGSYQEGVFIKNQLDRKRKELCVNFKSQQIPTLYVKKNLSDYDIVHFAGHCEYDSSDPGNTGWEFTDGRFTVQDILTMGETFTLPALVFSNACYSARPRVDFIESDYQQKNYNMASAFLYSGVRHYLGATRKIEDPVSLVFAKEFYGQLIAGKSVGEALRLGRLKLVKGYGIGLLHWTSYLLYGDPKFVLFKGKALPPLKPGKKFSFSPYKKQISYASLALIPVSMLAYLYVWLPSRNPGTYVLFARSQKLFQQGENLQVIQACRAVIQKDPLFPAVYPLLADTYQRLGDRENALKNYFQYALISGKKNDPKGLASAYVGIGWTYYQGGDYPKARDFYDLALQLSRKSDDKLNEAAALRKLALWHMDKKEDDLALELLMRSSEINRDRKNIYAHKQNLACDYFNIGLLFTNKEDLDAAKEFYLKSLGLFEAMHLKQELSDCFFNLGEVYKMEKQYQKALDYYTQGLKIDEVSKNAGNMAGDYDMMGELYQEMGDSQQAERFFNQALETARRINAPLQIASANFNLGLLYKQKGRKNMAREYFRQAQEIYSKVDTPDYEKVKQELLSMD